MKKWLILLIIIVPLFMTRPPQAQAFSIRDLFGGSSKDSEAYKQCVQAATETRNHTIDNAKKALQEALKAAGVAHDAAMTKAKTKAQKTAANKQLQVDLKNAQKKYDQANKAASSVFKASAKACKK